MGASSTRTFALVLVLISIHHHAPVVIARHDISDWLIPGACGLVAAFDGRVTSSYCTSALQSAPFDPKAKNSLHGLAWISMNLLKQNVTSTKAEIERMIANDSGKMDKFVKDGLVDCISMYDEAVDRVTEGLALFDQKKYGDADLKVVMIQGDGYECEAWFTQKPGVVSPLTERNRDCTWLSAMTALLIRTFDKTYTPWGTSS
ncbi:hypothetical protein Droror1_Dr00011391 [Drosera rotundifolia]